MILAACPTCLAAEGSPCTTAGGNVARAPHVDREVAPTYPQTVEIPVTIPKPPTEAEVIAEDSQAVWRDLTPVQADSVYATAALLLRDPTELALELFPHLYFPKDDA